MSKIAQFEIDAHRGDIAHDVRRLVEKYRALFDWDVPDIDPAAADALMLNEVAPAVEAIRSDMLNI